ncbi:MAG TPA: adenosylhomocysteinase [Methanothrix soehngenii]|nr:adenosylhomocysteinase [Methanotrichaceae archaeon]HQF16433.1 adenosylhomocysteinase [Methanotrichaceae archaeon]HQI53786.1 adenosylhomocysteinase [Methanothrix soehngenii]HQI91191.1 adenosylhomocysteinase [Methanotrichaceae archaeon]HQJ28414.1 adenosylhomocysteinase [Methanotrichaceae archaeon]
MQRSVVKDPSLASAGEKRIEWARRHMPVLQSIREEFEREKPLKGIRVVACLHVTVETANLITALAAGGAEIAVTASNPLSTQDDVAAALAARGLHVYAFRGENEAEYYQCMEKALDLRPNVTLDDGADTIAMVHKSHRELLPDILGGCEETTTGVVRLRAMAEDGALGYPVIAVNDAETKMMFDNRYGTGQSTVHGIMNATNFLFAGKTVVVGGYGWCGRGFAMRARGMGASVIVVEVEPRKALEAAMDGYQVMSMKTAAPLGDLFVTLTGDINVIRQEHFSLMKDQAILANSGHFNVEIDIPALEAIATHKEEIQPNVVEYKMADGRRLYLLAEGRLINLAAAFGHPPEVMDMSFANQALAVRYIAEMGRRLESKVYAVPVEIDRRVAALKLAAMGIEIERLTEEQNRYLHSWQMGT